MPLLSFVIGKALELLAWAYRTGRGLGADFTTSEPESGEAGDDVLVWVLVFAAVAMGVFFLYFFITFLLVRFGSALP